MAFGSLDARGIWKYGEDDTETTFSALLNKGMTSVSDAVKYFSGTAAQRAALVPPPAGAIWKDTDGSKRLWSVGPDGNWRRHSGKHSAPSAAWEATSGPVSARTISAVLPTVLSTDEDIVIWHIGPTGYFSEVFRDGITRGASSTTISVRYVQFLNATQTTCTFAWAIVPTA